MKDESDKPRYRSGTAARLARMPSATLRVWEQRYGVTGSAKSPSGQRLYSRKDIDRLVLIKALVDAGYAIGSMAGMSDVALASLRATDPSTKAPGSDPVAMAIVGFDLADVDNTPAQIRWTHYEHLAAARASATFVPVDGLLVREPELVAEAAQAILELADRSRAARVAVVYTESRQIALDVLRLAGVQLIRERGTKLHPMDVVDRLSHQSRRRPRGAERSWGRAPPRFSAVQLQALAAKSEMLVCECPLHLTALVKQIAAFEAYSDRCASATPADALMHRYLGDVAGRARELFEQALEHFADDERFFRSDAGADAGVEETA